jgi:hypothetical protein
MTQVKPDRPTSVPVDVETHQLLERIRREIEYRESTRLSYGALIARLIQEKAKELDLGE